MRLRKKQIPGMLLVAVILFGILQEPVWAENQQQPAEQGGVTVTTSDAFMAALQQKKNPITIEGTISVSNGAQADGRMLPLVIPGGTVIQGKGNSSLNCRCPIQLEGDDVVFQNMELTFDSSNALESVPHREIFLAGHSLTFDNVSTYLEGNGGSLGMLGGTEKELLPTVYAGGYSGTSVGSDASLTIENSNSKTMFQGIYMGHGAEQDNKVPYSGTAVLKLDAPVTVREGIYTSVNSSASVYMTGSGMAKATQFYGNDNTTLNITQSTVSDAVVDEVGNVVLDAGACLTPQTDTLNHVMLKDNACLDFSGIADAVIKGDFSGGQTDEGGVLVLGNQGTLTIQGTVTGTTRFQTENRNFPGLLLSGKSYIIAGRENPADIHFVLSDKDIEKGYELRYENGAWTVCRDDGEETDVEIGSIEILSAPTAVDISTIMKKADDSIPDESVFCKIVWRDTRGNLIHDDVVEENTLYDVDYVIRIRTGDWESDDPGVLDRKDWGNLIRLVTSKEHPGNYYLQALEGANTGAYTFLFCSEPVDRLDTVADVKALKDRIKAELKLEFYDSSQGEVKPPEPGVHVHHYTGQVTKEATCQMTGTRTYTCSGCGEIYTEEIPLKAHVIVTEPGIEATCVRTGKTQGSHCSLCGTVIQAQQTVPLKPHSYQTRITKATADQDGSMVISCTLCGKILQQNRICRPGTVVLSTERYVYNGRKRMPSVKVQDSEGKLISSKNYTVAYRDNKNAGKAQVMIRFQNQYDGTLKKSFTIVPKSTSISGLTAKSRGFAVKWKKQSTQVTGYEIQYSANSKFFGKETKITAISKKNAALKTITKLKAKKKYYVRIRTYKTVKVNGKSVKICSDWSKVKTVTTKK